MITSFSGEYEFLSNFYTQKICHNGIWYPTNEHAFQAAKSIHLLERLSISSAATPGKAKRMGRRVVLERDWSEEVRMTIMREILLCKFFYPNLRAKLLATKDEVLIEGNNWGDQFWGCTWNGSEWVGRNELGRLLMGVRCSLAQPLIELGDDE